MRVWSWGWVGMGWFLIVFCVISILADAEGAIFGSLKHIKGL